MRRNVSWAWFSGGWDNAKNGVADFLFQFHHQPFAFFAKYALAQSPQYPINGSTNAVVPGVDKPLTPSWVTSPATALVPRTICWTRTRISTACWMPAPCRRSVSSNPIGEHNSHPGYASVKAGQSWVANIVGRIKNSPIWPNTVIFICYDETWRPVRPCDAAGG